MRILTEVSVILATIFVFVEFLIAPIDVVKYPVLDAKNVSSKIISLLTPSVTHHATQAIAAPVAMSKILLEESKYPVGALKNQAQTTIKEAARDKRAVRFSGIQPCCPEPRLIKIGCYKSRLLLS